jgi:hypothetical protein
MAPHRIDRRSRREERLLYSALRALEERSLREGRSLSNLAAVLVERAMLLALQPTMNRVRPPADLQNSCD